MSKKDIRLLDRLMNSTIDNICQSMFDDFVRVNAEASNDIGLNALIIRQEVYKCCDWCHEKAGIYKYGEEPREVYQRHDNCKCVVLFKREKGAFRDVWSKENYAKYSHAREARLNEINRTIEKNNQKLEDKIMLRKEWESKYKDYEISFEQFQDMRHDTVIKCNNTKALKSVTGQIRTDKVIITAKQKKHIFERHKDSYEDVMNILEKAIKNPREIILDSKHKATAFLIEPIEHSHDVVAILRIAIKEDPEGYLNSIISGWKMPTKKVEKLRKREKTVFKKY